MKPPQANLDARRPVWEALSDMFLDTDVALDRHWRAAQLAASPYSLEELDTILADEVYPVCKWNLMSVAGVWTGFEEISLQTAILRRLSRRRWRRPSWPRFDRPVALVADEWRQTRQAIAARRETGAAGA